MGYITACAARTKLFPARKIDAPYIVEDDVSTDLNDMIYRFVNGLPQRVSDNGCHMYDADDDNDFEHLEPGLDEFDKRIMLRENEEKIRLKQQRLAKQRNRPNPYTPGDEAKRNQEKEPIGKESRSEAEHQ